MTGTTWRRIGLFAAVGAAIVPFVLLSINFRASVRPAFEDHPAQAWTAAAAFLVSFAIQLAAIVAVVMNASGAEAFAVRVAKMHAFFALTIGVSAGFAYWVGKSVLYDAWVDAWLGGGQLFIAWLPLLLLLQWVAFTRVATPLRSSGDIWRGLAIPSIALCATLGFWTFVGDSGNPIQLFTNVGVTFFNIGVLLHLVAIWQIAVRGRADWLWSGLIGFGCLISGFILANGCGGQGKFVFPKGENGSDLETIGSILYWGWYLMAPYLPIIAYVLAAIASVAMYKDRRRVTG